MNPLASSPHRLVASSPRRLIASSPRRLIASGVGAFSFPVDLQLRNFLLNLLPFTTILVVINIIFVQFSVKFYLIFVFIFVLWYLVDSSEKLLSFFCNCIVPLCV